MTRDGQHLTSAVEVLQITCLGTQRQGGLTAPLWESLVFEPLLVIFPNFSAAERRAAKKVVQNHNRQPATGAAKLQITVWAHKGKPSALQPSHKSVLVLTKLFCAATSLVNVVTPTLQTLSLAEPKEIVKNRNGWQHLTGPAVLPMTCLGAQR